MFVLLPASKGKVYNALQEVLAWVCKYSGLVMICNQPKFFGYYVNLFVYIRVFFILHSVCGIYLCMDMMS